MFKIDCDNKMTITKGDKAFINFRCGNYLLTQGDNVIFTVRKDERTIFTKQVGDIQEKGIVVIDLDVSDTNITKDVYTYTIRVITSEGVDETVIESTFNVI